MCTLMSIEARDGSKLTGRTNEFTAFYKSELVFEPRNSKFKTNFSEGTHSTWENKYSFIHQTAPGIIPSQEMGADGLNEHGLSISLLYFHYHDYKELKKDEIKPHNVNWIYAGSYILGNYKNVEEIKKDQKKLEDIFYWDFGFPQAGLGCHFAILDKNGDSVVVEPERKQFLIKENPLKVLTNSSPLEFHYENLRKYSHLNSPERKPVLYKNLPNHKLLTQGNGLFGIPGDFTADSRFVRSAIFSSLVDEPDNQEQAATWLFRMLHTADLVPGFITDELGKEKFAQTKKMFKETLQLKTKDFTITDHTDNILVKDMSNLLYYYKTSENITPRVIDMKKLVKANKKVKIVLDEDKTTKFTEVTPS